MKKIVLFALSFVLVAACILMLPTHAHAAEIVSSGTCGDNLTWTFDSDGTLTISGTGEMGSYTSSSMPWYKHIYDITSIVIEDGVTSISS